MVSSPSSPVQRETSGCITIGSRVTVCFSAGETRTFTFTITSDPRAVAPDKGVISDQSPLGAALLGKSKGDIANFTAGGRPTSVEITSVRSKAATNADS